ncbi:MAG: hypothetical protein V1778_03445 [bacterium]
MVLSHLRDFFKDRFLFFGSLFALLENSVLWLFLSSRVEPQTQNIPLHYNIYFGIDLVGPWWYLLLIPAAGLLALCVNSVLSLILQKREKVIPYFLLLTSIFLQAICFWALYLMLQQV